MNNGTITQNTNSIYSSIVFFLVSIILLIYSCRQIYLASLDPQSFSKNFSKDIVIIVLPIIIIFCLVVLGSFEPTYSFTVIIGSFVAAIMFYIVYSSLQTNLSTYIFNNYLLYALYGLFLMIGLAIVFTLFSSRIRRMPGWTGFFVNMLFYIPCLIRDFIQMIVQDYHNSSTTVLILFAFEIVILLMYFFIVPFTNKKLFPNKTILLDDPVMLNKQLSVGEKLIDKQNTNSSISFWVYLNAMPTNKLGYSEETDIFNYYDTSNNLPHFRLTYSNVDSNNDFIMYVGKQMFTVSLPLQSWNNFVINFINYNETPPASTTTQVNSVSNTQTTVPPLKKYNTDIFINGVLKFSYLYPTDGKSPSFLNIDKITIGSGTKNSNAEGLYGSLCNAVYYTSPLTKLTVVYNYNSLMIKNPPLDE